MTGSPTAVPPVSLPTGRDHPFDPPTVLGVYRDQQPLCRMTYPDGHTGWLATSYDLARAILSNPSFSSRWELQRSQIERPANEGRFGEPATPGAFIGMDPPHHTRLRRLFAGSFSTKRVAALEPRIAEIVAGRFDVMEAAGPPFDLVSVFDPVPARVICELIGVPARDHDRLEEAARVLNSLESSTEEGSAAWHGTITLLRELVRAERGSLAPGLMDGLVGSERLSDEELAGAAALLLLAGHDTTASMLTLGSFVLLSYPEQRELLQRDPERVNDVIEELLRYLTIFQFGITRTAVEDVELNGLMVRAGETVTVSLPAANRDPQHFAEPDAFDPDRAERAHLAFGYGIHQCIGQQLARVQMRVGYTELFRRFPSLRVAGSAQTVPLRKRSAVHNVGELRVTWGGSDHSSRL